MNRWLKGLLLPLLAGIVLTPLAFSAPASAQDDERCFAATGYCISGQIRAYWEANGGLPVFGYPITSVREETIEDWTGPVQWFERDRLEDHSAQGQGVLAGRLGAQLLEMQGRPWQEFPTAASAPAGCRYFEATQHTLCEPFLSYWNNNGGLERFGFPVTEPIIETLGDWTGEVQYFERRRMEHHTENAGTPFEVLLGLLGREVRDFTPPEPTLTCNTDVHEDLQGAYNSEEIDYFRTEMGCPGEVYEDLPAAVQTMERGQMIWSQLTEEDQRIWAYLQYNYYQEFPDTFQEGVDPEQPNVNPPEGLYAPRRGFGKVWINNPNLRQDIGWALEANERAATSTVQIFDNGVMVWVQDTGNVLVGGAEEWQARLLPQAQP
jgi:hypothetical protein